MNSENHKDNQRNRKLAVVDPIGCTGCEVCVVVCPVNCIKIEDSAFNFTEVATVDQKICTGCCLCAIDCPWETISMVYPDGSLADYSKQLNKLRGYV
jgi:Pyruvate/2-oxoacid:ferredoxin oxidoreductase delta subunit